MNFKKLSSNKRTALFFTAASLFNSFATLVTGVLVITWITPSEIGFWNSIVIFKSYMIFAQLGVFSGLNRDLPFSLGKNQMEKVVTLLQTGYWFSRFLTFSSFVLGILILLYLIISGTSKSEMYSISTLIVLISSNYYYNYLVVTFRANKEFNKLSRIYLVQGLFVCISIILVYQYHYSGFLLRTALLSISIMILTHIYRPYKIKPVFLRRDFIELVKTGLPLYSLGYLQSLVETFSRLILIYISGTTIVGYFSPALAILAGFSLIPSILAQYIYPQMSFEYGKTNDTKKIWKLVWKSSFGIISLLTPISIIGIVFIPYLIKTYFPLYVDGIFVAQMVLISGIFSSSMFSLNAIYSTKSLKTLLFLTITKIILYGSILYLFAYLLNPLDGIGIGLVIASILYFIIALLTCNIQLKKLKKDFD